MPEEKDVKSSDHMMMIPVDRAIDLVLEVVNTTGSDVDTLKDVLCCKFLEWEQKSQKASPSLPEKAPKLWVDRDKELKQSPVDFVQEVYSEYLESGLSLPWFAKIDMALYQALARYKKKNRLPENFTLPNKKELIRDHFSEEEWLIYHEISAYERRRYYQLAVISPQTLGKVIDKE